MPHCQQKAPAVKPGPGGGLWVRGQLPNHACLTEQHLIRTGYSQIIAIALPAVPLRAAPRIPGSYPDNPEGHTGAGGKAAASFSAFSGCSTLKDCITAKPIACCSGVNVSHQAMQAL